MFEYAVDKELIDKNPMEKVRIMVKFRQIQRKTERQRPSTLRSGRSRIPIFDKMYQGTEGDIVFSCSEASTSTMDLESEN